MQRVLVIDDNPDVGKALQVLLRLHDIDSLFVLTPQAGMDALQRDPDIALVIQDMNFSEDTTSGAEGRELFHSIRQLRPELPVVLLTAWTQLEVAVELVKQGAADYLAKPWDDVKLLANVQNLLELQALRQAQACQRSARIQSRETLAAHADLCGLVYQSDAMQALVTLAVKIANTDVPVLITGPNGAGKEKVAQIVQRNSRRRHQAFVCVNLGALPGDLLEAELFGADPGAYTGLNKTRIGRFEAADGGTLFLDELANLSAEGQAKLLRVLQCGEFQRLGSSETRRVDVRVISATNADLQGAVFAGRFREDLYYRLNVIELAVPPLSERREDVLPLLHHFLGTAGEIEPACVRALQAYEWPGNIRQLENACKRASILRAQGDFCLAHFGIDVAASAPRGRPVVEPSRQMIEQALAANAWVIAKAARQLGLSRQALYRRMEQYDIDAR